MHHTTPKSRALVTMNALALAAALVGATTAGATDFIYVGTTGPSSPTWNNTAAWTPAGAFTGGDHTYTVNNGQVLRTTDSSGSTFAGGTLNVLGQLNLQAGDGNANQADYVMSAGSVMVNAKTLSTQTVAGTIAIGTSSSYFKSTGTNANTAGARNMTITALVAGGPDATAHFLRDGVFTLANAGNTFSGTWQVGGSASMTIDGTGNTTVANGSNVISSLDGITAGALGVNAGVTLGAWSRFDVDYDWNTSGTLILQSNGGNSGSIVMTLDQSLHVGGLSIADTVFDAGTYDYDDFATAGFADYFSDGLGSITVIPEPSALATLFGVLVLGAAAGRRRTT